LICGLQPREEEKETQNEMVATKRLIIFCLENTAGEFSGFVGDGGVKRWVAEVTSRGRGLRYRVKLI
jgi:hypothetical protein